MSSVSLSIKNLPDATLDLTDGTYTLTVTGLTGLTDNPRAITTEEDAAGVVSVVPPIVSTEVKADLPLLLVRAVEIGMDQSLLVDDPANNAIVYSKHHQLIGHLTRLSSHLLMLLEVPT